MGKEGNIQLPKDAMEKLDLNPGDYIQWATQDNKMIIKKHKEHLIELPNETINEIKKAIEENDLNQTVNEFVYDVVKEFITKQDM